MSIFKRTEMLIGQSALEKLKKSRVAVFGVGGVGGYTVEALARCGIGEIDIIDKDTVAESNINRQIIALKSTIGKDKVDVMEERIKEINESCIVNKYKVFFLPENADCFDFKKYDYVIDAVDTVAAKICIIEKAKKEGVRVISSMGAGNKLDPTKFEVTDIYKTSMCPLAKVMRRELRKRNINNLKVVYSTEKAITPIVKEQEIVEEGKRVKQTPGSIAFIPSVAGLIVASEVVKDLCN